MQSQNIKYTRQI